MADRKRDRFQWLMDSSEISLEAVSTVGQIPAADWDACASSGIDPGALAALDTLAAGPTRSAACVTSKPFYNPFVSHAFFSALEASKSACARTGWGARHLIARRDGEIAG